MRRIALAAALVLVALPARAQDDYPNRPPRILVPYPVGGVSDNVTRLFAAGLSEKLGKQFVIENKPGAGTNIAAAMVATSAPDGYTFYLANFASHSVNRWLYKNLTYDPAEFEAVAMFTQGPMILCVHPSLQVTTVKGLVELAKQKPGKLSYGSPGIGSPNHIVTELFKTRTGIDIVHVPYKGAADAGADLVAGRIELMFDATILPIVRAGKVNALAVAFSERWPTEPQFPSLGEVGYPDIVLTTYFGLVAPAKTPTAILDKVAAATREIAQRPDIREKVAIMGHIPFVTTRQETAAFLRTENTKWKDIVAASGAKVE
ncbi:MAG: tripartite tricarboxylate transporter substrate binding protein [Alphaproteobacteria bacterium]|nr:tripartite tricarboxylate transporter substrate binding protein [Alphaproteobacteria bacterium]